MSWHPTGRSIRPSERRNHELAPHRPGWSWMTSTGARLNSWCAVRGDRRDRLPLPDDVGRAIAGYRQRGRPSTGQGRHVFLRLNAPHRGLSSEAVSAAVCACGHRAGGHRTGLGSVRAHRLRHTAATELVAAGAPLTEVGQLLRHRKALTTAIYAKVDRNALAGIARRWPVGAA